MGNDYPMEAFSLEIFIRNRDQLITSTFKVKWSLFMNNVATAVYVTLSKQRDDIKP
jgi:hypothetical protein